MTLRMKKKYVTNSLHHTLPLTLSVSLVSMLDIPIQSGLGVRLTASFCIIFLEPIPRPNAHSTTGLCRTLFSVRTFFSTAFGATGNQEKCCAPVTPVLCGALHALAEVSFRLLRHHQAQARILGAFAQKISGSTKVVATWSRG